MGTAIAQTADASPEFTVAGVWARDDELGPIVAAADVLVDFSLPGATETVVAAVLEHRKPLVCGVSGLSEAQQGLLDRAAADVAVVYDRNMSLGIAVLEKLVREAAASLGAAFEVEVHETHHVHKVDAPSGTALKLGEAIAAVRGLSPDTIHYEVERRGEVAGEHTVLLSSASERLVLGHSVTTRQVFADGALRAAGWVVGRPPGRYTMQDVLFGCS